MLHCDTYLKDTCTSHNGYYVKLACYVLKGGFGPSDGALRSYSFVQHTELDERRHTTNLCALQWKG